jgi:hypothetical protein
MSSQKQLRSKVMQHFDAEIRRILLGHWRAEQIHDQLIKSLNGYVLCGIITHEEAQSVRAFAATALKNCATRA